VDINLQNLMPQKPTETERQRILGAQTLELRLAQIASRADTLDRYWEQFKGSCYEGQISDSFDRGWYALWEPSAMKGSVKPGCEESLSELRRYAENIRSHVLAAEEAARKDDVYPGTRREMRHKYRLDYPGWGL
jgi:hypothetical protein